MGLALEHDEQHSQRLAGTRRGDDQRPEALGDLEPGRGAVVLDLRETTFLDSTALGVIIAAMKALRIRSGRLVLVNDRTSITKTLAITGLDHLLTVESELEDAVRVARGD